MGHQPQSVHVKSNINHYHTTKLANWSTSGRLTILKKTKEGMQFIYFDNSKMPYNPVKTITSSLNTQSIQNHICDFFNNNL